MVATNPVTKSTLRRPKRQRSANIADEPTKAELMEDIRIGLQQACGR